MNENEVNIEMPTKQSLLNRISNMVKKYGKSITGEELAYQITYDGDFYMEDKRKSKLQFCIDVINNNYKDGPLNIYQDTSTIRDNKKIINYIETTEKELSKKSESLITESNHQDIIDKYIKENTNSIIGLKELAIKIRLIISTLGKKYNNAKYDYERNNYERQQEFYREILAEINKRLNKTESKLYPLTEASRNELLALAKSDTITRYRKSAQYKGFSIVDIDTTSIFRTDTITITCKVGDYYDTVEMNDILIWIQMEAERNPNNQVNTKAITQAIMESIDALEIKINCTCPDFGYRFAYQATQLDYKYGKPENRPANITNPHNYGSMCKHLIAMLSNKKWLQQVTGTIMDFIEKNIDRVNQYLRPKEGQELTLPDELARQNAKKGFWSKFANRQNQIEEIANDYIEDNKDYIMNADTFHIKDSLIKYVQDNFTGAKLQPNEINVMTRWIEKYKEDNKTPEENSDNIENNNTDNEEENNEDNQ